MYNSGFRSNKKTPDGVGTVAAQAAFVQLSDPAPTILSWSIQGSDDRALDPAGGQTVIVKGGGFTTGMTLTVGTTSVGSVTIVNSTQATFTAPAKTSGNYTLTMANSNGQAAILVPGLAYSTIVTWTTPAGSLGTTYETTAFTESVVATSDSAITYTLASGSIPTGATFNANGVITGTAAVTASPTTYSFSVTATDVELQDSTQSFTITVAPDAVTWVTPSSGATLTTTGVTSQTLSATDAAGYSVTYTANSLPSGLSLSGSTISGTANVAGTTSTLLTATAATTGRYATNTITWVVTLGDVYWPYNTLLLSASNSIQTQSFVADNSLNNAQLTVAGDTRANPANPYQVGYYSNYFDGTGDYLSIPNSAFNNITTGTIECWVYLSSVTEACIIAKQQDGVTTQGLLTIGKYASTGGLLTTGTAGVIYWHPTNTSPATANSTSAIAPNTWTHIAVLFSTTDVKFYINGTLSGTTSGNYSLPNNTTPTPTIGQWTADGSQKIGTTGYISNLRIVNGTAIVPVAGGPTTPLLPVANTSLLTCQSNRLIDNSPNNFTITKNGDTTVSPANPFTTVYQAGTQYYSTSFNGSSDYLTLASNAAFAVGSVVTMECWIYPTAQSGAIMLGTVGTAAPQIGWQNSTTFGVASVSTAWRLTSATLPTLNAWNHVAFVRTGTGTNQASLFLNGTRIANGTVSDAWTTNTGFTIGAASDATSYFAGSISNARLVKGTAVYDPTSTTITVPTSPLTAVSGTSLLTCQSSTFIDNSTNNFTITQVSTAKPVAVSPFTPSSYSNTAITTYGSGYFDGTGDYLIVPGDQRPTGDFTVESWIYPTIAFSQTLTTLFTFGNEASGRYNFGLNSTGVPATDVYAGAGPQAYGSTTVKPNMWTHLAWVRSGTTVTAYINGVASGSLTFSGTLGNATNMYIGAVSTPAALFTGYMSDFRYTKQALYTSNFVPQFTSPLSAVTNTQLLTLQTNGAHNNNDFKDTSSFNNLVTRNGNPTSGTFSPYGNNWSTYFSGANSTSLSFTPTASTAIGTSAFTIETWVYITSLSHDAPVVNSRVYNTTGTGTWTLTIASTGSVVFASLQSPVTNLIVTNTGAVQLNTWTHVAVVRDSSNQLYIYINGVSSGTTTPTSTNNFSSTNAGYIGYNPDSNLYSTSGYYSNLRIDKTAIYTGNFTPSTQPLTSTSTTVLLTCQSNRFVDNSPFNNTLTVAGSPTVQKFSPFGTKTVPSYYSTSFNNSTDYLSVANNSAFDFSTGDFTVEAWVYLTTYNASTYQPVFSNAFLFYIGSAGQMLIYNGTTDVLTGNSGDVPTKQWVHVAWSRASGTTKAFVDGVQKVSTAGANAAMASGSPNKIGNYSTVYFPGLISNLRVVKGTALYTSAFTPSTTPLTAVANTSLLTCQSSTFVDNSTNNFSITAATTTVKPLAVSPFTPTASDITPYSTTTFGGSMYFDGTGDYLSTTATQIMPATTTYTLEAWVYPTSIPATIQTIMSQGTSGNAARITMYLDATTGILRLQTGATNLNTSTAILANQWTHVAFVNNAGTYKVFVNGTQVLTGSNAIVPQTTAFSLGSFAASATELFFGYISDARVVPVALYTSNFAPPTAPATPTVTGPYGALTASTSTATSNLLLSGTSGGIIDATRTVDLETVADAKVTPVSPYNGSYYSNYFDGTGDYISSPYNAVLDMGTGDCTMECWFYISGNSATNTDGNREATLLTTIRSDGGALTQDYSLGINGNASVTGTAITFNQRTSGTNYSLTYTTTITQGVWHHIAVSRTGNTLNLLYDGTRVAQNTNFTASITTATGGNPLKIGGLVYSAGYAQYLNGYISNTRLIKGTALYTGSTYTVPTSPLTAVTNTAVLTCQSNKFVDNSTNAFAITVNGDTKVQTQNPFQVNTGQSYYFDGTGDWLASTVSPQWSFGTGDFTVEMWVYFASSARTMVLVGNGGYNSTASNVVGWSLGFNVGGAYFGFNTGTTSNWFINNDAGLVTSTFPGGAWIYVAVTRQSGSLKCFINGTQLGTTISAAGDCSTTSYTPKVGTDVSSSSGYYLNGYISDLRITKGVARYTTTFTPPTTPDLLD